MKNNRTYKVKKNISSGICFRVVSIILPFILRTVMIKCMGLEYAGINTLFHSVLQVLNMAELGIGSALTYSMYKPLANNDKIQISRLLNLYKVIYFILGMSIVIISLILLPIIPYLVKGNYPKDINIYIIYCVYIMDLASGYFIFPHSQSLLIADQRSDIINKIRAIIYFVSYSLQIFIICYYRNYYLYIIFTPICTVINNIIIFNIARKNYPDLKCKGVISNSEKNLLIIKIKALAGHKIGNVIVASLDSVVVSAYLGLTVVGIYGNYYYIITALSGIIDVIYNGLLASIGNIIVTEKIEKVYDTFNLLNFFMAWIVAFCCIGLVSVLQPFIVIWVGEKSTFPIQTAILCIIYFYSRKSRMIGLGFKDAAGLWEADFWKPYIGALINLILNITLVNVCGVNGVYIATIIVMMCVYMPFETRAIFKYIFKKSAYGYITNYIFYTLLTMVSCYITWYISSFIVVGNLVDLIIRGIIGLFIGNAVFLIGIVLNNNTRVYIKLLFAYIKVI